MPFVSYYIFLFSLSSSHSFLKHLSRRPLSSLHLEQRWQICWWERQWDQFFVDLGLLSRERDDIGLIGGFTIWVDWHWLRWWLGWFWVVVVVCGGGGGGLWEWYCGFWIFILSYYRIFFKVIYCVVNNVKIKDEIYGVLLNVMLKWVK